jgi:tRNA threonylcarbamoyladenosine biosynthesis protein TsaE
LGKCCVVNAVSALQMPLPNLEATLHLGTRLAHWLPVGSVLLLQGDLGSGKTSLVQGLGTGLGITEPIVSPTFTLVNEYPEARMPLYHLDLYRLSPAEVVELHPQHYWQGLDFPLGIVAIEWPERLWEAAELGKSETNPSTYLQIELIPTDMGRVATLTAKGGFSLTGWSAEY